MVWQYQYGIVLVHVYVRTRVPWYHGATTRTYMCTIWYTYYQMEEYTCTYHDTREHYLTTLSQKRLEILDHGRIPWYTSTMVVSIPWYHGIAVELEPQL